MVFEKHDPNSVKFTVKNVSSRDLKILAVKIPKGESRDLLSVPHITESHIMNSLIKGRLGTLLKVGDIQISNFNVFVNSFSAGLLNYLSSLSLDTGNIVGIAGWNNYVNTTDVALSSLNDETNIFDGYTSLLNEHLVTDNPHTIGISNINSGTISELNSKITNASLARVFTITDVKIDDYVAAVFETIRYDASGGGFTITAPPNPSSGDQFRIKNVTTSITSVTIDGNSNDIEDPGVNFSLVGSLSVGLIGLAVTWEFSGNEWLIVSSYDQGII